MKIHYIDWDFSYNFKIALDVVCGLILFTSDAIFVTKDKSKVTCKNCKRTKLFRGVK